MGKMGRKAWYDQNGMKKGAWSQDEDYKLRSYIQRYGHWNWRQLPKFAGLARCGKSCRLRWLNYLREDVKRGNFSKEEESLIIELREKYGNKWCDIASKLPGRTDNEVKNYWHSKLKKRVKENESSKYAQACSTNVPNSLLKDAQKIEYPIDFEQHHNFESGINIAYNWSWSAIEGCHSQFYESSSSLGFSSLEFDYEILVNNMNSYDAVDQKVNSFEPYSETVENFWTQPFLSE